MTDEEMRQFLELGLSLSRERAMDLTRCDAGTLYLAGDDGLHFCRMETRSRGYARADTPTGYPFPRYPWTLPTFAPGAPLTASP